MAELRSVLKDNSENIVGQASVCTQAGAHNSKLQALILQMFSRMVVLLGRGFHDTPQQWLAEWQADQPHSSLCQALVVLKCADDFQIATSEGFAFQQHPDGRQRLL